MKRKVFIFFIAAVLAGLTANAYNLRQSYNVEGLPNSAILSMSVDGDGLLWIGTCDGVSIADGLEIVPFSEMYPGLNLSGNLIERILYAPDGVTWILTNHGLDRFNHEDGTLISFPGYKGGEFISVRDNGDLFLLSNQGHMYTYVHGEGSELRKLVMPPVKFNQVLAMTVQGDTLMIVDREGVTACRIDFDKESGTYSASGYNRLLSKPLNFAAVKGDDIWAIDRNNVLGRISPQGEFEAVLDVSEPVGRHGAVSDIISDRNGNIYISFSTNGVVCLNNVGAGQYDVNDLELKVGVFSLQRSDVQDVVWIGSDCQGVYTLSNTGRTIRTVNFSDLDKMISHPIRSIYLDRDSTLWLGTKGSGILRIDNFNEKEIGKGFGKMTPYTTGNSVLHSNSVFAFVKGAGDRLWIATDNGLNFYDFKTKQLKRVPERGYVNTVYDIYEVNDTTLLLATLGNGIIRVNIEGTTDAPVIGNRRRYVIGNGERALNYFFSITDVPGQGIIVSNRGQGAFRLENDSLVPIPFKNTYDTESTYDIFTAVGDSTTLWLGSGHGLVRMGADNEKLFSGVNNGFLNNTIHDILKDRNGDLWISTNKGLVKFNPATEETLAYTRDSGLGVSEFSDGAAFATDESLIFGGVDGFVVVEGGQNALSDSTAYMPDIQLQRLNILGENANVSDYLKIEGGEPRLTLSAKQNQFSVTFCAPDFIDAANYTYYYSIDNEKDWINNGSNRTITFNELGYGTYRLYVKYANRMTGVESRPYVLRIKINAPWYLSTLALLFYFLLIIAAVILFMYYLMRRQKSRQKDELKLMEYTHREQVYEEKLRFFTNITHEFSTPLTLIYGPCERILTYAGADDYIRRYVGLIRTNAERLNNLIQELIDFRRIETGHKKLKIHSIDISGLCKDTIGAYAELAETNHIDLRCNIADDIVWNSDFGSLRKVLNNLISNAFKYTPVGGTIEMDVRADAEQLTISVYNTGKGIREEDKDHIFNRYAVLDNVEENAVKGLSNRNGLGLAICHSIVEMLKGTITIESVVGEYAKFIVTLPPMEKNTEAAEPVAEQPKETTPVVTVEKSVSMPVAESSSEPERGKQTVLVIDDNQEILALLSDSLNDYNVITASSADEGLALVTQRQPDLIITDVMMPGADGFELTRQIKSNIHTRYIPLIILSAKNSTKERVDGIESGADVYIGKPFSLSYLLAVIKRLLEERTRLREYYNSSASAYEYSDGRLLDRQSRDIMEKAVAYVDSHLDDGKLSPESLADYLQISLRNLYRKFKELDLPAPNDFIKNQRMAVAAKLLLTTSDTVQEIMYRTGFTNRSHFYKEFGRRYGMTPGDYRAQNRKIDNSLSEK